MLPGAVRADHRVKGPAIIANASVADRIEAYPAFTGMGTTLLPVEIEGAKAHWTSIGDSVLRRWSARHGKLAQLNVLHNVPSQRNRLRSAVTGTRIEEIDYGLLVASDGLDALDEPEIERWCARANTMDELATGLAGAAVAAGGAHSENTTVIASGIGPRDAARNSPE